MKKLLLMFIAFSVILAACGEDGAKEEIEYPENENFIEEETEDSTTNEEADEEESVQNEGENTNENEKKIDISMYEYTENIDVTDAIEINNHITLMIEMDPSTKPGLAFQHVLNNTYDFLLQDIVQQADTVGINVIQNGVKLAMFTVHPKEFTPNDEIPMADLVLEASVVEMITPELEEYAEVMELPIKKAE